MSLIAANNNQFAIFLFTVKDGRRRSEGLNGSQLKFFNRTWPMSQIRPNMPLF
jgi:hypothetical protein